MNRPNDLHVLALREIGDRLANPDEAFAKALAPVRGDNDEFAAGVQRHIDAAEAPGFKRRADREDRVNAGVAGDFYTLSGHTLAEQILRGPFGCREM